MRLCHRKHSNPGRLIAVGALDHKGSPADSETALRGVVILVVNDIEIAPRPIDPMEEQVGQGAVVVIVILDVRFHV